MMMDLAGVCIEVNSFVAFLACLDGDILLKVAEALLLYVSQLKGQSGIPGLEVCVSTEPEAAQFSGAPFQLTKCKVQGLCW